MRRGGRLIKQANSARLLRKQVSSYFDSPFINVPIHSLEIGREDDMLRPFPARDHAGHAPRYRPRRWLRRS
jgi:hypothetical protein